MVPDVGKQDVAFAAAFIAFASFCIFVVATSIATANRMGLFVGLGIAALLFTAGSVVVVVVIGGMRDRDSGRIDDYR